MTAARLPRQTYINVKDYGALGDNSTDDRAAIQAAINATDANRGGTVFFPQGRYLINSGLNVTHEGTVLEGEGKVGTPASWPSGSSQIIVANGITGITFNTGTHKTTGYGMRNLHVNAAAGSTTGDGIHVEDAERFFMDWCSCSGFIAGNGLRIHGVSNAQYASLFEYSAGDCLYGLHATGVANNGLRIFGGYFKGRASSIRSGSIAVYIEGSDSFRAYGTNVQGWDTGVFFTNASPTVAGHELYGARLEGNNTHVHVGANSYNAGIYGGSINNNIIGSTGTGVLVDAGAQGTVIDVHAISAIATPITDNGTGTRNRYAADVPLIHAGNPNTVVTGTGVELLIDTTNHKLYLSNGAGTSWTAQA